MTSDLDIQALAFFTADHAAVAEGKLYVNGGCWDKLQFPRYPQAFPMAVVAVLLIPYRAYHQDHRFGIDLEDADGRELLHVEGQFRVGTDPAMRVGDPTVMPFAVPVNTMAVQKPGDHAFVFRVDGTEIARYRLRAVQIAAPVIPGSGHPSTPGESASE